MIKKLLILIGILVVLFAVGVALIAIFIDPIVRRGVEMSSASALKVPTHLGSANVKFSGKAVLNHFEVDNPSGFKEPKAIVLERLDVSCRPAGLFDPAVHVEELTVVKPEVTLEFSGTKSNLSALMDNLSSDKPAAEKGKDGKKFLIRKLRIEGGTVKFRSDQPAETTWTVALPPIELENVGTAEGGASMAQVLRVLLQTLGTAAMNAGEGVLPKELLESLRADLTHNLQELQRNFEDAKSRERDPNRLEKTLKDLLEKKAD